MASIQELFYSLQENKKQRKDIRSIYVNALASANGYREIVEEIKVLREKKKRIEIMVRTQFERELQKLDDIKQEMRDDIGLLTDAVLTQVAQGKIVKVCDAYNNSYDPIIKVSFKKSDENEQ